MTPDVDPPVRGAHSIWEVFARRTFEDPLAHVGSVEAEGESLASVYARAIYNEFTWVEMVVYPRASGVSVIRT